MTRGCAPSLTDFDELLITMTSGRAGGEIRRVLVDYTADGRSSQLVIPWKFAVCGDKVADTSMC